jgi:hydroxypyruvate reductase
VLSNSDVLANAADEATRLGFHVEIDNGCDDWDFQRAAEYLLRKLCDLRTKFARVCLISGGEVTVEVADGGVGGRNQQIVLALAKKIAGENITALSAGTDGIDGNSPAAGAVADGTTRERAHARSLDLNAALADFNAYPFFDSIGDVIVTGHTGNNLRDVRILLTY